MSNTILIVEDELNMRKILEALLKRQGYLTASASNGLEALTMLRRLNIATIITDLKMPGMDGLQLLTQATTAYPHIPIILITAHGSIETAVDAMKRGAFDFITKPFEQEELTMIVSKAIKAHELGQLEIHNDNVIPLNQYGTVGQSAQLLAIHRLIDKIAASPTTVLITGESGTGKGLLAQAIHSLSTRTTHPFIKVNCAAIPETLLESELFGHEKGAFTGAIANKPGRFELAHMGTLFLDEIGELPREMQVKLLRVLQDKEFERVGGLKTIKVDIRLIAATNRDLELEVKEGRFRQDLYYRLNVIQIHVPPLRERREDIPLLVSHFIEKFNKKLNRSIQTISRDAMNLLLAYPWTGNIRELENIMERAVLLADGPEITTPDLPQALRTEATEPVPFSAVEVGYCAGQPLKEVLKEQTERLERNLIIQALKETGGNVTKAAEHLRISRKSLQLKMKEYGLRDLPY